MGNHILSGQPGFRGAIFAWIVVGFSNGHVRMWNIFGKFRVIVSSVQYISGNCMSTIWSLHAVRA